MILITTGTINYPFKRLVKISYDYFSHYTQEKVIIQTGAYAFTSQVSHISTQSQLPFPDMIRLYQEADLIVAAAGEGSATLLLHYAQSQPILFPRRKKYGEHIDDQQVMIAKELTQKGLVLSALNESQLVEIFQLYQKGKIKKNVSAKNILINQKIITFLKEIFNS
jgi:UDP-N-acetylglucosamine transferase subunit ALG13